MRLLGPLLLLPSLLGCAGGDDTGAPFDDETGADTDTAAPLAVTTLGAADVRFVGAPSSAAGSAVAGPGDLDGDGRDDLVISAFYASLACVAYAPLAPGAHPLADQACVRGSHPYDFVGYAVAGAGDVDDDGLPELLVSALGHDEAGVEAGKVFLFTDPLPAGTTDADAAPVAFLGEALGDQAGARVAAAGNTAGDDVAAVLVGATGNDAGGGGGGRVYLLRGPFAPGVSSLGDAYATFTGAGAASSVRTHGESTGGDGLGDAIAAPGDLDGDGVDDLALGASGADDGGADSGVVWVLRGPVSAGDHDASMADARRVGAGNGAYAGGALAGGGDLDGDGLADLLVAADGVSGGRIYVLLGPVSDGDAPLDDALPALVGDAEGDLAGWSVAITGDTDGDMLPDVLIGAPGSDAGGEDASDGGVVYLVTDAATPGVRALGDAARALFAAEAPGDAAGRAVSGAGDVDGDGVGDLLAGAQYNQAGGVFAGQAYLVLGASLPN
jgi:hypothetical protein